jgi:hypothetical protein
LKLKEIGKLIKDKKENEYQFVENNKKYQLKKFEDSENLMI